jgi:multicomponent Na+:H+ antiporter subunit E
MNLFVRTLVIRVALLGILWWAMSRGNPDGWWAGMVGIALALVVSFRLIPLRAPPVSLRAVVAFFPFFVTRSMRGGLQVAKMAVRPQPDLHPAMLRLPLRLSPGPARTFLACIVSLFPGALCTGVDEDCLCLHVLDHRMPNEAEVREAESMVARIFRQPIQ